MSSSQRVHEIDGLRFFAIFSVLAVHYRPPFRPHLDALALGWAGVDLFFVISGFLITSNLLALRGTPRPYRVFYWRRALRIFPAYYLVFAGLIVLGHHFGGLPDPGVLVAFGFFLTSIVSWPAIPYFPLLAILHSLHRGVSPTGFLPVDNHVLESFFVAITVLWSLSIEELFYLVWAPVVLKCSRHTIAAVSLGAVIVCPVIRLLCHQPNYSEYFCFPARFDALTYGALLALGLAVAKRQNLGLESLSKKLAIAAVSSASLLAWLSWFDGATRHIEIRSALSFAVFGYSLEGILFASVLGLCVLNSGRSSWWARVLRIRPLTYIGEISYMIYLIHIPVYVLIVKLGPHFTGHPLQITLTLGWFAFAVTVALASVSWKFYEKPLLLRFRNVVR